MTNVRHMRAGQASAYRARPGGARSPRSTIGGVGAVLLAVVLAGCEGRVVREGGNVGPVEARVMAGRALFEAGATAGAELFHARTARPRDLHFAVQALLDTLDRQRRSLVLARSGDLVSVTAPPASEGSPSLRPGAGLPLHALTAMQRRQVHRLLRESLAPESLVRVRALAPDAFEGEMDPPPGPRVKADDAVRFLVLGAPGASERWGWRLIAPSFIVECEIGPDTVNVSQAVPRR